MKQELFSQYKQAKKCKMLYKFQKQALDQSNKDYFYALDTGTGKTITSIHHYMKYSNGEPLLIVAPPQKIKEGGWERDLQAVSDYYGVTFDFEQLSYGVLAKRWEEFKGYFVIYDEAHYIKNPTSQRGRAGMKLSAQATGFVLLTATPMANGWEDAYNYMIMFGKFRNKTAMNRKHAIYEPRNFGARTVNIITDWRNENELESYYKSYSVSIRKEEALDLPPLVFKDVQFKPSKDYYTLLKDRVLNDEAYDTPSKLMHGLRQHTNHADKLDYLKMMLEGLNNNIVVFYQYTAELEAMKGMVKTFNKKLGKKNQHLAKRIYEVNGGRSELPPKQAWNGLEHTITFIQYQAGSAGIELQYANIVVFYTPTYSYQDYTQALGRTYRNGQNKKVTVYRFKTQQTIEEDVYRALEQKKDFDERMYLETRLIKSEVK